MGNTQEEQGSEDTAASSQTEELFSLEKIYPDAESIFKAEPQPLEDIKDECLVVLDTNALLLPYSKADPKDLGNIRNVYSSLVKGNRLVIPGHVAREFARNRAGKLRELHQQLVRRKSDRPKTRAFKHPLLKSLSEHEELEQAEEAVEKAWGEYSKVLDKLIGQVRSWNWNDPVTSIYNELFARGVIAECGADKEDLVAEFEFSMETHRL